MKTEVVIYVCRSDLAFLYFFFFFLKLLHQVLNPHPFAQGKCVKIIQVLVRLLLKTTLRLPFISKRKYLISLISISYKV